MIIDLIELVTQVTNQDNEQQIVNIKNHNRGDSQNKNNKKNNLKNSPPKKNYTDKIYSKYTKKTDRNYLTNYYINKKNVKFYFY